MSFWRALDSPNIQRVSNLITLGGFVIGTAIWAWQAVGQLGGPAIMVVFLAPLSVGMILVGASYYFLLFIRSRGWLGAPKEYVHIHHERRDAAGRFRLDVMDPVDAARAAQIPLPLSDAASSHTDTTPAPTDEALRAAPRLRWLDPAVELLEDGRLAVNVWCENSGPAGSVAVVLRRAAESRRPDGSGAEEMTFEEFNAPSYIHSIHSDTNARWQLKIRSVSPTQAVELGPREVRWWSFYYDNDIELGYMTEASLVADVRGRGQPAPIIGQPALDATSPRTRNERAARWIAQHGAPTT